MEASRNQHTLAANGQMGPLHTPGGLQFDIVTVLVVVLPSTPLVVVVVVVIGAVATAEAAAEAAAGDAPCPAELPV